MRNEKRNRKTTTVFHSVENGKQSEKMANLIGYYRTCELASTTTVCTDTVVLASAWSAMFMFMFMFTLKPGEPIP